MDADYNKKVPSSKKKTRRYPVVPLPFTGIKCQPHSDISRTARIHTAPVRICCNISRCNRRTCRDLSVNFKQFSPATPKPSSIYIRPFPLSLIPIRYFSFCDTGFLIKIPDSQHLFRKYRNFSVKFQQMYSLFHGVLFFYDYFQSSMECVKSQAPDPFCAITQYQFTRSNSGIGKYAGKHFTSILRYQSTFN